MAAEKKEQLPGEMETQRRKPKIITAGDSTLKGIKGWLMSRRKAVKSHLFPGADTTDMESYFIPLLSKKPDRLVLQRCKNERDLAKNSMKEVAERVVSLASMVAKNGVNCSMSEVFTRGDELWGRIRDVNRLLGQTLPENIKVVCNLKRLVLCRPRHTFSTRHNLNYNCLITKS